jgi:hypothetical protein
MGGPPRRQKPTCEFELIGHRDTSHRSGFRRTASAYPRSILHFSSWRWPRPVALVRRLAGSLVTDASCERLVPAGPELIGGLYGTAEAVPFHGSCAPQGLEPGHVCGFAARVNSCPSQFETLWVSVEASPRLRGPSQFDNCGAIRRQLSGLQNKKPRLLGGVCLICCLPLSLRFRSASRFAWRRNRCR